jgi:hypothetical protein
MTPGTRRWIEGLRFLGRSIPSIRVHRLRRSGASLQLRWPQRLDSREPRKLANYSYFRSEDIL